MLVTAVESLPKKKNRVYIDGEYAFMLYDRDIALYHLEEDGEISETLYAKILEETVIRRAHQKTVALLERMDRTESELRRRMKLDMYSEAVTDETIGWLKSLHYLDDERYTQNYIRSHLASSSRQDIMTRLLAKGISKEIFSAAYESCCEDAYTPDSSENASRSMEQQAAVRALSKKLGSKKVLNAKERMNAIGYMMRKGFRRNEIMSAFDVLEISIDYSDVPEE